MRELKNIKQACIYTLGFNLLVSLALPQVSLADIYFDQGVRYYSKGDFRKAAPYFEQSMRNSPWDSSAVYYAALSYHQVGDLKNAAEKYRVLVKTFPGTQACTNATAALKVLDPNFLKEEANRANAQSSSALSTSHSASAAGSRSSDDLANCPAQTKVYFTREGNSLFVDAQINNRPIKMIFDTGASGTLVGKNHLQQLGIQPPSGPATGFGAGVGSSGVQPMWQMRVNMKVGQIERHDYPIGVYENLVTEPLLGQTFFNQFAYTIDNGARSIVFTKRGGSSGGARTYGAYDVPFHREGEHVIVNVEVDGSPCAMIFDTGAEGCSFSKRQAKQLGITIPEDAEEGLSRGVGGETKTSYFYVRRMKMGPIDKSNVQIGVVEQSNMSRPLLGQTFFGDWQYTIDNAASVIHLVRR